MPCEHGWRSETDCDVCTARRVATSDGMDRIADRKYPPPIEGADWTVSAVDMAAVTLSIALSRRVPGWPGATDEQLGAVAREVIAALDGRPMEQTVDALSAGAGT